MKTLTVVFWFALAIMAAFIIGRYFERMAAVQSDLGRLNNRVLQLEDRNVRRDANWGWLSKIWTAIPYFGHLFHRK